MKTIKDAHKALKGDLENSFFFRRIDKVVVFRVLSSAYICLDKLEHGLQSDQYVCTVEEFNNYKPEVKPVTPTFTQEMVDNGVSAVLVSISLFAYRLTLARKMTSQYPWIYERAGLLRWRDRRH